MPKTPSSNDTRANVKNPNNPAYVADRGNRIAQGHSNVPPPPTNPPGATSGGTGVKQ